MATPIPKNEARFAIADAARAVRGTLVSGGSADEVVGVTTDSRAVAPGSAFVALRGETHDAHRFVPDVVSRGAALVVAERGRVDATAIGQAALLEVDDTLVALGDLARAHLERWRAQPGPNGEARRVVAITGSAGKTTTKELTAALLGAVARTHFTAGNLNNRVGVPSMVLSLTDADVFTVLEMGMSVPGEIAAVAAIARPDVAIITNIGLAHAEGVGGREGVLREKSAVYAALPDDGVAIVNADDDFAIRAAERTRARRLTFGRDGNATYRLVRREARGEEGSVVELASAGRTLVVRLPLPGEAAAVDLAAALAAQEAASGATLEPAAIERALGSVRLAGRAALKRLGGDIVVLDDTYNANPSSMRAALATLGELGAARRRVAVLGEMKELGAHAEEEHAALGAVLAEAGVALAIGCGGLVGLALERAEKAGIEVVRAESTEAAARETAARVRPGDAVLVKGSRGVGAERVVLALTEAWPSGDKSASSEAG